MTKLNTTNSSKIIAINDFRRLWRWVSEDGSRVKGAWPEWKINGGDVPVNFNYCPLCGYVKKINKGLNCDACPIKWPFVQNPTEEFQLRFPCCKSYYQLWSKTNDKTLREKYARIISELPEKSKKRK